jgi:hypothetical protein
VTLSNIGEMMDSQERPDADRFDEYDCRPEVPDDKLSQENKDELARFMAQDEAERKEDDEERNKA